VSEHTLAELERLDFGSWRGTGPARVLTLDRLLHTVRDAGRPVRVLIETKHPNRYGGLVERRLVELLRRHRLVDPADGAPVQVTVMSFSPLALRRVRRWVPALPTVQLVDLLLPRTRLGRLPFGTRIAGPSIRLLRSRPNVLSTLREAGHQVYVWTVNCPTDLALVRRMGVGGVSADYPAGTLAALGRGGARRGDGRGTAASGGKWHIAGRDWGWQTVCHAPGTRCRRPVADGRPRVVHRGHQPRAAHPRHRDQGVRRHVGRALGRI